MLKTFRFIGCVKGKIRSISYDNLLTYLYSGRKGKDQEGKQNTDKS